VANRTGLATTAAAFDKDIDVKLVQGIGHFQWLTDNHPRRFTAKVLVQWTTIDVNAA
jgi:hypothetical protein